MSLNEIDFLDKIKKDIQSLLSSLYELLGIGKPPSTTPPTKPPKQPPPTPRCAVVQSDKDDDVYLECIDCAGSCKIDIYNASNQRKYVKVYRDGVEEFSLTVDPRKHKTINTSCNLIYNYKHKIKVVSPPKKKPKPPPPKPPPKPKEPTTYSGTLTINASASDCREGVATVYNSTINPKPPSWVDVQGGYDCLKGGYIVRVWNLSDEYLVGSVDNQGFVLDPHEWRHIKVSKKVVKVFAKLSKYKPT